MRNKREARGNKLQTFPCVNLWRVKFIKILRVQLVTPEEKLEETTEEKIEEI